MIPCPGSTNASASVAGLEGLTRLSYPIHSCTLAWLGDMSFVFRLSVLRAVIGGARPPRDAVSPGDNPQPPCLRLGVEFVWT